MVDAQLIPGMIEPIEQKILYELGRAIDVDKHGCVVEFGTFFGRSTACIMRGLGDRSSLASCRPLMYAFDSFNCRADGEFAKHVRACSGQGKVEELVETVGDRINFRKVFEHYLEPHTTDGSLQIIEAEIKDSQCPCDEISLMHIDAPKFYNELKIIMDRFFPKLKNGSVIVFQDYFFHWSGTIIAAIQFLLEAGVIRISTTAASSLVTEVVDTISLDLIEGIDKKMQTSFVPTVIDRAINSMVSKVVDRPTVFLPRMCLSKIPYYWETGRYGDVRQCVIDALGVNKQNTKFDPVTMDLLDMFAYGFDAKGQYDLEHE